MVDKEGAAKDHGALRKHREKRRAKATCKQHDDGEEGSNEKNSLTASTEASLGDFIEYSPDKMPEKQEMVSTIIATTADREKMRKISILGLEDPADRVRQSRREEPQQLGVIVATETSLEQMRKISKLGLEDPADNILESKHTRKGRRKDRESKPLSAGSERTKHRVSENGHSLYDETKKSTTGCDQADNPLDILYEKNTNSPRQRSRSVGHDHDIQIFEISQVPKGKKKKPPRTRSFDLDQSLLSEEGMENPPVQVVFPQQEFTKSRTCGPKEFGGVIEATKEQQLLMRKVSALGMIDPVFGNIHKDMEISHASIVFEDMDLNDVPRDMRDLLGHTSEHTDPVIRSYTASPESEIPSSTGKSNRKDFAPPKGSFVRRGSKQNNVLERSKVAASSPARPEVTKSLRVLPARHGKGERKLGSKDPFPHQVSNSYNFIPPSGSFNVRKPSKRSSTPTRDALLKDIELAARAQSMFARDSLLGMSASNLESNLHASLGSINFEMSVASLDGSIHSDDDPEKGFSPQPLRGRRSSSPSDRKLYIPPSLLAKPTEMIRNYGATTTSEASLSQPQEIALSPNDILGRTSADVLLSPRKRVAKQYSTRSWDGDKDLQDPMARDSPMWASLSVLNTDLATLESALESSRL